MSVTQVDLDDDALNEVLRLSGAKTRKDTVNLALREYAARHRRVEALERHVQRQASGTTQAGRTFGTPTKGRLLDPVSDRFLRSGGSFAMISFARRGRK